MKTKLVYVLAGAIALGFTTFSKAEDKKPEGRPEGHQRGGNFTPEQREKMLKEIGLTPDDVKGLSDEARRAKIKEAGEKKMTELQKKKTDGTITDQEKESLERMEKFKKFREQSGGAGGGLEAMKQKHTELKKKEADGTITEEEKKTLKQMEDRRKEMQEKRGDHGPRHGDKDGKAADEKK
ncbi:MAG: hypothetical protein JWM68_4365 [Verrucomicrobiales bacterium]|nr:hypothetical protein [Verrucomicrobiales bacterium]